MAAVFRPTAEGETGHALGHPTTGLRDIADWFETLARAARSHAHRSQKALDGLGS